MSATTRIALVIAATTGCGKQLNAEYCAVHPNDSDCRSAGLVLIDAPAGCKANLDCTAPGATVCDLSAGTCVECTPMDHATCSAGAPACGLDDKCHGCVVDADCTSTVCLPTGSCADASTVLYAAQDGGTTSDCSLTSKCNLETALGKVASTGRHIIKLDPGTYAEAPLVLNGLTVQILGGGAIITKKTMDGALITVNGGNVEIADGTIQGATGGGAVGVNCKANATLTLHHLTIANNADHGVTSMACSLNIDRSTFTGNTKGAIIAMGGAVAIVNNFMFGNGASDVASGNVTLMNITGRFQANSVAYNISKNGNAIGGVSCIPAGGPVMAGNNIIAGNGGANSQVGGTCNYGQSYTGSSADVIHFVSQTDLHLTKNSPKTNPVIIDNSMATDDCKNAAGAYIDDIDGAVRPFNGFCDLGADEFDGP